jgi:FMNH2-dependent dimethyl sulfone monooxygenase
MTALSHDLDDRASMNGRNAFKLGIFGVNCSSGLAATKVPERWSGSWEDNLALAQMLDSAGIDFMLPVGRWKGYGGETSFESATYETISWACGLLAQTKRMSIFATVHAPLVHPVFAAKAFTTADHIGRGRFGLNLVCGWNQDEFDMFGVDQRDHERRYGYGKEWVAVVRRIWGDEPSFDFDGEYIKLKGVEGNPKPYGGTQPLIMNAGASDTGKAFAINDCDFLLAPIRTLDQAIPNIEDALARARAIGKHSFGVITTLNVVCRPTQAEADDYYRYYADEQADWEAVDRMVSIGSTNASTTMQPEMYQRMRVRFAAGYGGFPIVGTPDSVAEQIAKVAATGFTGGALGFVNFLNEFPYFRDEVLPRLERMQLRAGVR